MKFKINRDHFSAGLQLVSSVVGSRKTMPILQNVLIEAKEGLSFTIHNQLRSWNEMFNCRKCEDVGSVTLPVKELGRIVRELADMEVSVTSTGTPKATISTRGSIFNIIGMDSKEFPPFPELKTVKDFTLAKDEMTIYVEKCFLCSISK